MTLAAVRALTFDVFGTTVDWRTGVAREVRMALEPHGPVLDWGAFADAWRARYKPAMAQVREGRRSFVVLDVLQREMLDATLAAHGMTLPEDEAADLAHAWRRLDPWPDTIEGMRRLRTRFALCALSNANVALMIEMSRFGGLTWDALLGGDVAMAYKPDAAVYDSAAARLGLEPGECLMVAAHPSDLRAAKGRGFRTAYVHRPLEYGPPAKATPDVADFDIAAESFVALAERLGV